MCAPFRERRAVLTVPEHKRKLKILPQGLDFPPPRSDLQRAPLTVGGGLLWFSELNREFPGQDGQAFIGKCLPQPKGKAGSQESSGPLIVFLEEDLQVFIVCILYSTSRGKDCWPQERMTLFPGNVTFSEFMTLPQEG